MPTLSNVSVQEKDPVKASLIEELKPLDDQLNDLDKMWVGVIAGASINTVRRYLQGEVAKVSTGNKILSAARLLIEKRAAGSPMPTL